MPWLLNEDAALKTKLQGLKVNDVNEPMGGRPVAVRFRLPETELGDMTLPIIIIEHAGISKDSEREHRGRERLNYIPEGYDPRGIWPTLVDVVDAPTDDGVDDRTTNARGELYDTADPTKGVLEDDIPYFAEFPIPYNLDYQVTVYSRKALHNRDLLGKLAAVDRLPHRFGYLEIPQDGTIRRLDLIGGPTEDHDKDRDGKRIFRSIYAVRVSSELIQGDVDTYYTVLSDPELTLEYQQGPYADDTD
jgi:hypothetical protein